jgi:hypothetical protein
MTKRRIVVCSLLVAIGVLFVISFPTQSGVTMANYDRIEIGMTRRQVETILGEVGEPLKFFTKPADSRIVNLAVWNGDGLEIFVDFDEKWVVVRKTLHPTPLSRAKPRPNFLKEIIRRISS